MLNRFHRREEGERSGAGEAAPHLAKMWPSQLLQLTPWHRKPLCPTVTRRDPCLALDLITGLLAAMTRDLRRLSRRRPLVTAFSLVYALSAPVMGVLTAGLERRRLLAIAMAGFALATLLAALAPNYASLLVARLLVAHPAASFMPAGGFAATLSGHNDTGAPCPWSTTD
jgi:hypothetical protein